MPEPAADRALSQRLERAEARASVACIEARVRRFPDAGAAWLDVGGTYAMFDGPESPFTQTFGLGMFGEVTEDELATIERFFTSRGAGSSHELSPHAGIPLLQRLVARGYVPIETSNVLYQTLAARPARAGAVTTRVCAPAESSLWARISSAGWATEAPELADFMFTLGEINAAAEGGYPFLAELAGRPIAAGMLFVYDDVALLAGAATIPEARNQGAQAALLEDRLAFAAARGCTLAMMVASPGSQSQRNAEKRGFRIAYTRTKWQRAAT